MSSNWEVYRNISAKNIILRCESFQKYPDNSEESLQKQFTDILGMTIQELHEDRQLYPIYPYMIGITYVHRFINTSLLPSVGATMGGISFPDKKMGIVEIVETWKPQDILAGPLSGTVFIADRRARKTRWAQVLIDKKASPIGYEQDGRTALPNDGAAFCVANQLVVFAINKGIHPNIKRNAEVNRVFTISIMSEFDRNENITITTRCFADLRTVAATLGHPVGILKTGTIQKNVRNSVVVALGWRDYKTDEVLFHLGQHVVSAGHRVDYFFLNKERLKVDVKEILESEDRWKTEIGKYPEARKLGKLNPELIKSDDSSTSIPWKFILSPVNAVAFLERNDETIEPAVMTIPIKKDPTPSKILVVEPQGEESQEPETSGTEDQEPQISDDEVFRMPGAQFLGRWEDQDSLVSDGEGAGTSGTQRSDSERSEEPETSDEKPKTPESTRPEVLTSIEISRRIGPGIKLLDFAVAIVAELA